MNCLRIIHETTRQFPKPVRFGRRRFVARLREGFTLYHGTQMPVKTRLIESDNPIDKPILQRCC